MPKMNGIEMAKKIKEFNEAAIVIFASAYGTEEYLMQAIEIGVDGFIKKPIDRKNFLMILTKFGKVVLKEKELEEKNKFIQLIFEMTPNFMMIVGDEIFYINKAMLDYYEVSNLEEFKQKYNMDDLIIPKDNTKTSFIQLIKNNIHQDFVVYLKGVENHTKRAYLTKVEQIPGYDRQLIVFNDITKFEHEKEQYRQKSQKDPLTKIYNRDVFFRALQREIDRTARHYEPFSIVMFDIDFFKKINDTYGHQIGDIALQELTALVQKHIRGVDVFARYGGEEFIILLPDTNLIGAVEMAKKLKNLIENNHFTKFDHMTCSFGVVQFYKKDTINSIVKKVDDKLYQAKREGRNRVVYE